MSVRYCKFSDIYGDPTSFKYSDITEDQREDMPLDQFCGPGRSFPVPDVEHARLGLAMLERYKGPGDKEKIKKCLESKLDKFEPDRQSKTGINSENKNLGGKSMSFKDKLLSWFSAMPDEEGCVECGSSNSDTGTSSDTGINSEAVKLYEMSARLEKLEAENKVKSEQIRKFMEEAQRLQEEAKAANQEYLSKHYNAKLSKLSEDGVLTPAVRDAWKSLFDEDKIDDETTDKILGILSMSESETKKDEEKDDTIPGEEALARLEGNPDAADEIDKLTKKLMKSEGKTYVDAFKQVCKENKTLTMKACGKAI
jgi:hypothetical protein